VKAVKAMVSEAATIVRSSSLSLWHPRIGIAVAIPLMLNACTGMLYRILRYSLEPSQVDVLLRIHSGEFLSFPGSSIVYCLFLGLCALALVITARPMIIGFWSSGFRWRPPSFSCRVLHRQISSFVFVFVAYSAFTGLLFGVLSGFSVPNIAWLKSIHNFNLFPGLSLVYTILLGIPVATMVVSGLSMVWQRSSLRGRCPCLSSSWHHRRVSSLSQDEFVAVESDDGNDILLERVTDSASSTRPSSIRQLDGSPYSSVPVAPTDIAPATAASPPASSGESREDRLLSP